MECLTTGDGNYFLTHLFLPLIIGNNTKEQRFSLTPFVWVTIGTRLALDYILWQTGQWPLRNVHTLILRTCEYVTLHGKRDFADAIKDIDVGRLSPNQLDGPSVIIIVNQRKAEGSDGSRDQRGEKMIPAAFEDGEGSQEYRCLVDTRKSKEMSSLLELPKRMQSCGAITGNWTKGNCALPEKMQREEHNICESSIKHT